MNFQKLMPTLNNISFSVYFGEQIIIVATNKNKVNDQKYY